MAKITKNDNGLYQARVYLGRNINGKQDFEYLSSYSLKEIKAMIREVEDAIDNNDLSNVSNMKFATYMDDWLDIVEPELKPSTYKSYKMYVNYHFKPALGKYRVSRLNELLIRQYISNKLKAGLSPTTVRKHFFILNKMLQEALKNKNPCRDIKPPKKEDYKPYVLCDHEFELIHSAFKGTVDELIILLAAWCGLRLGEIFALRWNDINGNTIKVDEAKSISEDGYVDDTPKSERGIRDVAAPKHIIELFETLKRDQLKKGLPEFIFKFRPDGYSKRFGRLIDAHNKAYDDVKKGSNKVYTAKKYKRRHSFNLQTEKLPDVRFHDLRHYHATVLYKNGIPDHYAAERLGHDVMVLKKIYQHLQADTRKEMDNKIINLFDKSSGE